MTKLLVIAGEASGDLHGGKVLIELKKLDPEISIIGTGGRFIASTKAKLYYRVEELAVIGFWEVLKQYGYYKNIFNNMVKKLDEERPDAVFLVDYVAFNLKFAEEAKKRGIKVICYVAPQVWAWKKNRIRKIKKFVDHLIVLFPFEVEFFKKEGMKTHCFGHPLLDIAKPDLDKEALFKKWGLDNQKKTISLLPGSRRNEITKHLPLLLEVAQTISSKRNDIQFVFPMAPTVNKEDVFPYLDKIDTKVCLVEDDTYNTVAASDFAVVASGTATLETAILNTPLLIFYKVSAPTYMIGHYLLGIKMVGLPNIVADEMIAPEMIQNSSTAQKMTEKILAYLDDPDGLRQMSERLQIVKRNLGEKGAYEKTGRFLYQLLKK
ncbi:MAG: lipid-A-disaccharide synthase [Deltaproteobacteria bacterium]|nr:lipid-A-disaccharide synthase [Deltaproteobacteria bacterium]